MTHTKKSLPRPSRLASSQFTAPLRLREKKKFFIRKDKNSPFEFMMTPSAVAMIKAHSPVLIDYLGLGMNGVNICSL